MTPKQRATAKRWFEYFAQAMVFYSILTLFMEAETQVTDAGFNFWRRNERMLLLWFTAEYFIRWALAPNRTRYPISLLGIIDLLAILPVIVGPMTSFRSLKLLRALLMLRLLKLYRYHRALQNVLHGFHRVRHELAVVSFVAVVVLFSSSLAMYEFEHEFQPVAYKHMWDSIWWSFVTLTTVGYGDIVPVTVGGRLVGIVTMVIGIGIFGTFISLIGSSFLTTMREEDEAAHQGRVLGEPEEEAPWSRPAAEDPTLGDMPG